MKEVEPQEKPAKKKRRLAPVLFGLLFLVGFGILAYPTISNQWNTYRQNQLISNYEDNLQSLDATDFTDEWQKAEAFNQTITDNDLYGDVFGEDDGDLKNTDYWKWPECRRQRSDGISVHSEDQYQTCNLSWNRR